MTIVKSGLKCSAHGANNTLAFHNRKLKMKIHIVTLIASALLLQGCSAFDKHHGVNWGDGTCPAPTASEIDKGHLKIEDGKTLKCQIRPYVSNMACQGITDKVNTDGVICQNGPGANILFIFDSNGVLKSHRRL